MDLQCVQSSSSVRGIGRYALCLSRGLAQTAGDHQLSVLLNAGDDPDRLLRARTALESFLPARDVHVFQAAWPFGPGRTPQRRRAAEAARTAAIRSLRPDAVLVGSVFEGDVENVTSIAADPADPPTAAVLYDLIPAADPGTYLLGPGADDYWRRFEHLRRADLLLSISDYSAAEAQRIMTPGCPPTATVWGGPYPSGAFPAFEQRSTPGAVVVVPGRYLLAVGGDHPRKNLDRLVEAWGHVPAGVRAGAPLVLACRLNAGTVRRLRRIGRRSGLGDGELVLTGEVTEDRLAELYDGALAFVFPSTEEGLGMPPLEAMSRGCPTVLARSSSLVELAEDDEAFVDPTDVGALARVLAALVLDSGLRDRLRRVAAVSAGSFTWHRSGSLAWRALEDLLAEPGRPVQAPVAPVPVLVERADAVRRLPAEPAAVLVGAEQEAEPGTAPADRADAPDGLIRSARATVLRTALSPATALVLDRGATARDLVRAGLLDQPLLLRSELARSAQHDPVPLLAGLLESGLPADLERDIVTAAARPARWTLERPGPVVLVLRRSWEAEPGPLAAQALAPRALLACGDAACAPLAAWADHVLVEGDLVQELLEPLHRARRMGAGVHVVSAGSEAVPAWLQQHPSWAGALAHPFDRRTGWPWQRGA